MRGLAGKIAVVTGGAQGLGKAISERLSEEGCEVWMLDLNPLGEETARAIEGKTGGAVHFELVDIRDEETLRDVFRKIEAHSARVDLLVNNAARFVFKGLEASAQDWNETLGVNVVGTSLVTQHCVPLMKKVGRGAIVNMSSVSGFIGQPNFATYNATKFAIRALTKCWAIELSPHRIRVNSVCPGYIRTEAFENSCRQLGIDAEEEDRRVSRLHILGRQGLAEEVAGAVAFAASDDASFMTGEDLVIDGGYLAI
ncbi:SDR family NAD(P)-dependent oxidoreductase [Paenibacillus sacheonensis]|uniref:SDR family oxidoreductase n=1 Tax=Paenibacillus sacheonensis TaxID=742054 RepID=A0A7X5C1D1_9BACL|nr:SDR family oxidoreductase [Paenibacillus sacheonensis]MBM7568868.1 dihydroanticapsin dehydrogenase [Paenibacillus sacheonensis]NBC72571.1 SDR family oxidoreductase [Paenibacillus sacheonensis]